MLLRHKILENPIRTGLVKRVEDDPFRGSLVYSPADLLEAIGFRSGFSRTSNYFARVTGAASGKIGRAHV